MEDNSADINNMDRLLSFLEFHASKKNINFAGLVLQLGDGEEYYISFDRECEDIRVEASMLKSLNLLKTMFDSEEEKENGT